MPERCKFCHRRPADRLVGVEPYLDHAGPHERLRINDDLVRPACESCADRHVTEETGREMPLTGGDARNVLSTDGIEITDGDRFIAATEAAWVHTWA